MLTDMKFWFALFIPVLFIVGFRIVNPPVGQTYAAVQMTTGSGSYVSSTTNMPSGAKTILFWSNKTSDTNLDISIGFDYAGGNYAMSISQRSAGGGNTVVCQKNSANVADTTVKPNYGVWNAYGCAYDGNTTMRMTVWNLNMSIYATVTASAGVAMSAATAGTDIGNTTGGANGWGGPIARWMLVSGYLTNDQMKCFLFSENPYSCGGGTLLYYCPLVNDADPRCLSAPSVPTMTLTRRNTPTTVTEPPTTPYSF